MDKKRSTDLPEGLRALTVECEQAEILAVLNGTEKEEVTAHE